MGKKIGIDLDNGDPLTNPISLLDYEMPDMVRFVEPIKKIATENKDSELIVVGMRELTDKYFESMPNNVKRVYASEYFPPSKKIIRPMRGTSLYTLVSMIDKKEIDGFYTIGDTSKVCVEALRLKRLEGVVRGSLIAQLLNKEWGTWYFSDIGASTQRSKKTEHQEAIAEIANQVYIQGLMSIIYSKEILNKKPRLGIFSNGEEKHKGCELTAKVEELFETAILNKNLGEIVDYCGKAEPKKAISGEIDILHTDGWTGNTNLKSIEASVDFMVEALKSIPYRSKFTNLEKVSLALGKKGFRAVKKELVKNIQKCSGAILLGYNGLVIKGHGDSKENEIYSGIKKTIDCVSHDLNPKIEKAIQDYSI